MLGWKKFLNLFVVFGLSCQLIACAKPDSQPPAFTEAPAQAVVPASATELPPSLTATETSVPMLEPALPPAFLTETLPVTPPNFETVEEVAEIPFDLTAAHAVYAYYRQEVGPLYNLPEANFIQEMSQYYTTTLEPNGIHLLQSAGDSAVYSLLTQGSQFFGYFTPDGVLADFVPGHWSKTGVGQWVEAGGTNGPLELFIGEDGLAYIAQLDLSDDVVYRFFNPIGATLDNLDEQWIPVKDGKSTLAWDKEQGQWVEVEEKLGPIETEFEGVFSEKYYPDQFTDSFTVVDKESGIEIPINIGLASGLPVGAVHLSELGWEYLGDFMLFASYYRYTVTMGNLATYEEYIELVKQGKGQVQIDYFDELTNEHKQAWYDPRNGVSITQTYDNEEMPLNSVPRQNSWDQYFYISVNNNGQLILVSDRDKRLLDIIDESGRNEGYNMKQSYSRYFYTGFLGAMKYWAMLTPEHFASGGLESLVGPRAALFDAYIKETYTERVKSINYRVDDRIPHMSVELSNR